MLPDFIAFEFKDVAEQDCRMLLVESLRRYQLYSRVKAALALPIGPERVAALQAAKIAPGRKH